MGMSEKWLAEYGRQQDAEAFASLVEAHSGMVFGTCVRILGNRTEAEDVTQECFLELARKAGKVKGLVGAWLHGVATRKSLHAARTLQRRKLHESQAPARTAPSDDAVWSEISPIIDEAIGNLPRDLRETLVIRYLHSKSQTEVAEKLGISQATVSRRCERAVEMLRRRLRKSGIIVSTTVLALVLSKNATVAASANVLANLGKIAVSGIGAAGKSAAASAAGLAAAKVAAMILAGAVVLGIGVTVVTRPSSSSLSAPSSQSEPTAGVPTRNEHPATENVVLAGPQESDAPSKMYVAASADSSWRVAPYVETFEADLALAGEYPQQVRNEHGASTPNSMLPTTTASDAARETPSADKVASVDELLARYRATQDKLQRFIIKSESSVHEKGKYFDEKAQVLRDQTTYKTTELRYDGRRFYLRDERWGPAVKGSPSRGNAGYRSFLYDGDRLITSHRHSAVIRETKDHELLAKRERFLAVGWQGAAPVMGIYMGGPGRIDSIIQEARTKRVRNNLERVGGVDCYVIDAQSKRGNYTVWIDPTHGYHIAKAECRAEAGDVWPVDAEKATKLEGEQRTSFSMEVVRFEEVDGVWVPMEANWARDSYRDSNKHRILTVHHKQTAVVLNPDFEALNSFVPDDIDEGARVTIYPTHTKYIWKNGKPVPDPGDGVKVSREGNDEAAPRPTVDELIEKLTAAQSFLKHSITKGEVHTQWFTDYSKSNSAYLRAHSGMKELHKLYEVHYEFPRYAVRTRQWGKDFDGSEISSETDPLHAAGIWDGKRHYGYSYRPSSPPKKCVVQIREEAPRLDTKGSGHFGSGIALLRGYYVTHLESVELVLAGARSVQLRDGMEEIGGSKCYVLDADTKYAKLVLWIDLAHGYQVARAEWAKRKGDLYGEGSHTWPGNVTQRNVLETVRFEKVDDVWVPMECELRGASETKNGANNYITHVKRTEVLLNPDFEKLGSFLPDDIKEGATVFVIPVDHPRGTGIDKYRHVWKNGKPVPYSRRKDVREIRRR